MHHYQIIPCIIASHLLDRSNIVRRPCCSTLKDPDEVRTRV